MLYRQLATGRHQSLFTSGKTSQNRHSGPAKVRDKLRPESRNALKYWILAFPVGGKKRIPTETFAKCPILFQFKAGENFNRRDTLSILRIKI